MRKPTIYEVLREAATCACGRESSVEETRPAPRGRIRRRRKCVGCGATWATYEEHPASFMDEIDEHLERVRVDAVSMAARAARAMDVHLKVGPYYTPID